MDTDSSFFKEWIKPIAQTIFSGLFFVIWWSWTEGIEADKVAKARLFLMHDEQVVKKLDKIEAREIVLEQRNWDLLIIYIDKGDEKKEQCIE